MVWYVVIVMRNNKMNKIWFFIIFILVLVVVVLVYVISVKYWEQFECFGCMQMIDGIICDIYKIKVENVVVVQYVSSGFGFWVGIWYVYMEYGDKIDEIIVIVKMVKIYGYLVEEVKVSQGKLIFWVKSLVFMLNDVFNGVWVNGRQCGFL